MTRINCSLVFIAVVVAAGTLSCDPYRRYGGGAMFYSNTGYRATTWQSILDDLLDTPAPPADWTPFARYQTGPPPDTASDEVLIAWWSSSHLAHRDKLTPSEDVLRRLRDAIPRYPVFTRELLLRLPIRRDIHDLVAEVVARERERPDSPLSSMDLDYMESWLDRMTPRTLDELEQRVKTAHHPESSTFIEGEWSLNELLERAPDRAVRLLEMHAAGSDVNLATWAWKHLLGRAMTGGDEARAARLRGRLKAIVGDPEQLPYARSMAVGALMAHDWPGRDDWFMALYSDTTLSKLRDGVFVMSPLPWGVQKNPDRLIPRVMTLLGHPDDHVHSTAARSLVAHKRPEALRALLPWLEDPAWIRTSSGIEDSMRIQILFELAEVEVPESVPALLHVIRHDSELHIRIHAATALANQGQAAREVVRELGEVLAEELHFKLRMEIVRTLSALNVLSVTDMVNGLGVYAHLQSYAEGRGLLNSLRSLEIAGSSFIVSLSIGVLVVEEFESLPEVLVEPVIRETVNDVYRMMRVGEPRAPALRRVMADWPRATAMRALVHDLAQSDLDSAVIRRMLERRASYAETVADELRVVISKKSEAGAIAAVLLGEQTAVNKFLQRPIWNDRARDEFLQRMAEYQDYLRPREIFWMHRTIEGEADHDYRVATAVLASARLARLEIDLTRVTPLLDHADERLARAAERYLVALDTPAAREVLYRRHDKDGEILILGARENFDPERDPDDAFEVKERLLIDAMKSDPTIREIHALMSFSEQTDGLLEVIVVVRNDSATLLKDAAERELTLSEKQAWMSLVSELRVTELPALVTGVGEPRGRQYQFVHLTRKRGRRVFMINPGFHDWASPYQQLITRLHHMPMP